MALHGIRCVLLCTAAVLTCHLAMATTYTAVDLSTDQRTLHLTRSDGSTFDAPRYAEQVGFQKPRISKDGRYVGWLALYPNCCTSYPIPLHLTVLDNDQQLHRFAGIQIAVFEWCFLPRANAVAYTQTVLHGSDFQHFELRSIADGRLLAEYEYPDEESDNLLARRRSPTWVHCVPEIFPSNDANSKAHTGRK